jgi:Flp pilus assembly protein TadD
MPSSAALTQARAAANKALELDATVPEAHATNGELLLTADWNWSAAETEFKKAIALNPSYAMAYHRYGLELGQLGRVEEAKRELELARELDPAPAINRANVAWAYYVARDYPAAIKILEQVLHQDPDFWVARWGLGSSYVQTKKYPEAVAELERAVTLSERDPGTVSSLAVAEARAGKAGEARKLLAELLEAERRQAASGTDIAVVYAALGQREAALAWLEKAYAAHAHDLLSLDADPWWDSLRADKRFQELRRKVGLAGLQDAGQQAHRTPEQ